NQPRERKFDFTRDYVVINELGDTYFRRSQQEGDRAERDRYLRLAVACFEQSLALDGEDLDAHHGLAQCYTRLGEDLAARSEAKGEGNSRQADLDGLRLTLGDSLRPREERLAAARQLCQAVTRL